MATDRPTSIHVRDLLANLQRLLYDLPSAAAVQRVRTALARRAAAANTRRDLEALTRLVAKARTLHELLGTGMASPRICRQHPDDANQQTKPSTTKSDVHRTACGPGLPGWGRSDGSRGASWHRPHAPIEYPYGDPPTGRMPASDILPSKPESLLPEVNRQRLDAIRRMWPAEYDEALDARMRIGRAVRSGPDDEPTWRWPYSPD